jgi:ElaB/YqjD/DUF883 family membrane-anchored ribosome-binding protein
VIYILNNLSKEYNSLIESIEKYLNKGADEEEVTVKRVRERVKERFKRMAMHQSDPDGQEEVTSSRFSVTFHLAVSAESAFFV